MSPVMRRHARIVDRRGRHDVDERADDRSSAAGRRGRKRAALEQGQRQPLPEKPCAAGDQYVHVVVPSGSGGFP